MQFHVRTFVECLGLAAYLMAAFALIGAPVKLLLRECGVTVGRAVPAPVVGMALVVVASWYWATPFDALRPVPRLLAGVSVLALVVIVVARHKAQPLKQTVADIELRQLLAMGLLCFASVAIVMVVNDTQLFTRENFTVVTLGNNDAPSYALIGQHLLDEGPNKAGNIAGYNAGVRSLGFSGGACALLAAAGSLTGLDVWHIMTPMMIVALTLGAYALALFIRRVLGERAVVLPAVISALSFSVLFIAYLVAQWFFAQLIDMGVVLSVLGIMYVATRSLRRRDFVAGVLLAALLVAGGLSIYPHMTIAGSAVLLPIAVAAPSFRTMLRHGVRAALLFGLTCITAVAAVPGLANDAYQITKQLEGVDAGWPLPSIFPSEMLGFQTSATAGQGWLTVMVSALILALLVGVAGYLWHRDRRDGVAPLVCAIAVVLVTYAVVYQREGGPTYRQWKWVTFFIPIFVASALTLLASALAALPPRLVALRQAGPLALGFYAVVVLVFSSGAGFPLNAPPGYLQVTLDEINLSHDDRLASLPSVHINTSPYWETMWLAYFLRDQPVTLGPVSYYPPAPAKGPWYLERNDQPLAPGAEATPLNDTYRLVKMPG